MTLPKVSGEVEYNVDNDEVNSLAGYWSTKEEDRISPVRTLSADEIAVYEIGTRLNHKPV
jgi:hypothetical protein